MLTGGKYNVYKKKYISGSWTWNYLAQTTNNYYEDATEDYCPPPPTQCENPNNIYYRVKAIDSQLKESVYSDSIKAVVNGGPPDKISVEASSSTKPTEYSLMQNYPNPFNPATTISYSIPKNGLVSIKVYDILGTAVAELVNEVKEAGNYSVTFNANNLPSGIYFYTLTSGNFTATKKLILLK
ncbi:MAG: T9SS type A sorting domain-containing protein [Ignavibacteriaceae bacterium]|nr:T9SS type A sorting domain-containing protein [Ignavibacteriaceae bacterium]